MNLVEEVFDPLKGKVVLYRDQPFVIKYRLGEDHLVIVHHLNDDNYFPVHSDKP
jgi:hypothetical protein